MGAWGIKALERDEGLDVLDILKNEYVPEHPVMDLGEMIELMKEEVMLGSDFSQIDFLFDNTAMALAELYFQWKDNGKLDYDHEEAIWDKVTGFTASKEALAFLLRQLTDIKNEYKTICYNCRVYLYSSCVLCSAPELFNFQMLLEPFKE